MTIRKALATDVSKLFKLEQEIFTSENFPLSRASLAYHVKNNLLFLAEVDGNIAGYALALIKRNDAKLYSLGVHPKFRSQKIALKLLETIIWKLRLMGFKQIVLEVRSDNEAAIKLYKNFGFEVTKTARKFYRDGCDAFIMRLLYPSI